MPDKDDSKLQFTKIGHMLHLPFVMYADFECVLEKMNTVEGGEGESWTTKNQKHVCDGFALYTKCIDEKFYAAPKIYTGDDSAEKFIDYVLAEAKEIRKVYTAKLPMKALDADQKQNYRHARTCYICQKPFITNKHHEDFDNKKKVADHCHVTGRYLHW